MNNFRNFAVWVIIAILLFALVNLFQGSSRQAKTTDVSYSDFLERVERGEVRNVVIAGDSITGKLNSGQPFETYKPPEDAELVNRLNAKGVKIETCS